MNYVWGSLMVVIGFFIFVSALTKSDFIIYRLIHARSRVLWGDHAHTFLMVVGVILVGVSAMFFFKIW